MRRPQVPQVVIAVTLVILFLVGCGGSASTAVSEAPAATSEPEQPAATSTPEPPSATPQPPTSTPEPPTPTPTPVPPTPTPTPIPPTATLTPIPPTPTPACTLKCNIDTEGYGFEVTCESGQVSKTLSDSTSLEYDTAGNVKAITVNINEELTYTDTSNTYKIVGQIIVDKTANTVNYDITATGGVFGDIQKTCKTGDQPQTTPSESPASTTATGDLQGLLPDDIISGSEDRQLTCTSAPSPGNYIWLCQNDPSEDPYIHIEFYAKNSSSVDRISASITSSEGKVDTVSADILGFIATLPYDGAEPEKAKEWVEQTSPTIKDWGDMSEATFGGVNYLFTGSPNRKALLIGF